MQFESFHWLSHRGLWAIMLCKYGKQTREFLGGFSLGYFPYFGWDCNKTIIPLVFVGYEIDYSQCSLMK